MDMSLNDHYRQLLGLDADWEVRDVDLDLEGARVVVAIAHAGGRVTCPECGADCPIADHAPQRSWRHLDTMRFETVLSCPVPRARCGSCGVRTAAIPWAGKHSRFTLMFEAFAIRVLQAADNLESARKLLGISWKSAHRIMERGVERGLLKRDLGGTTRVGLDEKSDLRAQSYLTALNDLDEGRVIEVVEGRTTENARELLDILPGGTAENIKAVALDMWPAFINAAAEKLPAADAVFDRFHVSKHLNEAVDKVRRAEHRHLRSGGSEMLTGIKYSWLKSPENLGDDQRRILEELCGRNLKTSRAWAIRETFNEFWASRNAAFAEGVFDRWYSQAIRSRLEPVKRVARMLKKHYYGLETWFEHRISNAVSEGLNSRIQTLKSAARGFRNFANYRTRILFFCGKLDMKPEISH
jgi:transposase